MPWWGQLPLPTSRTFVGHVQLLMKKLDKNPSTPLPVGNWKLRWIGGEEFSHITGCLGCCPCFFLIFQMLTRHKREHMKLSLQEEMHLAPRLHRSPQHVGMVVHSCQRCVYIYIYTWSSQIPCTYARGGLCRIKACECPQVALLPWHIEEAAVQRCLCKTALSNMLSMNIVSPSLQVFQVFRLLSTTIGTSEGT